MELPVEIVALIREYAKPRCRYHREYNRALKVLHLERWTTLRQMNEEIRDALLVWLDARDEWMVASMRTINPETPKGVNSMIVFRIHQQLFEHSEMAKFRAKTKFRKLTSLLYGKPRETYHLAHPKYRYSWY